MQTKSPLEIIESCRKRNLNRIDLSGLNLKSIPPQLFELNHLTKIKLSDNDLSEVSNRITELDKISEIDLSNNQFTVFPQVITDLDGLSRVRMKKNRITRIPDCIGKINNILLTEIDFSYNLIEDISESIGNLSYLTYAKFSNNRLSVLPKGFTKLRNLILLDLRDNILIDIPEFLFYIKNLEVILYENNIKSYKLIGSLERTEEIISTNRSILVGGNPIEKPPLEVINLGKIAAKNYFKELSWGEEYLYEAKLLIIGEPGAGKTSLAKSILDQSYGLDDLEKSTEGIEVFNYIFPIEDGGNFHLNIWDFGGQEIYHATHQFFLTKRSLYILLSDTRAEDSNFQYWLNIVELLASNSPLIIVQNEKQNRKRELNELGIRGRFSNLLSIRQIDLLSKIGVEGLIKEIENNIKTLPHIGTKLPKSWLSIRKELEELAKSRNYISSDHYLRICTTHGISDESRAMHLSGYLHDLGVFLHFQNNPVLKRVIILKPGWGTDAVYKVLDNSFVRAQRGTFSNNDLEEIWEHRRYSKVRDELLALMIKFELCYQIENSNLFIAPQLLPVEQPFYKLQNEPRICIKYVYEFMPKGIMTRFIVRMHNYIKNQDWVWKEGVILERNNIESKIIETYGRREINISVIGAGLNYRKDFLVIILEEFDKIHRSYRNIRVSKLIPCYCADCSIGKSSHFFSFSVLEKYLNRGIRKIRCDESLTELSVSSLIEGSVGMKSKENLIKLFISFSSEDELYRIKLNKHLLLTGQFEIWDRSLVLPGENTEENIKIMMRNSEIGIVLVSPDYCVEKNKELNELLALREKGLIEVIPILIRPGIYENMPFSNIKSLPNHKNFTNTDSEWKDIVSHICKLVEQ